MSKLFEYLKSKSSNDTSSRETMQINPARLLEVFKSLNYTLSQSICDIIDNSIDINADVIEVYYSYDPITHERYVMIVDNGRGMTEKEIQAAMTLGSDRNRGQQDLGKFGIGLKISSLAQAHEVTVISKPKGSNPTIRRISMDYIKKNNKLELLKTLRNQNLLKSITGYLDKYQTGTLVLLEKMDKITRNFNQKDVRRRFAKEQTELEEFVSMTYHRYLEGNNLADKKVSILFNNVNLTPLDPLLLDFEATNNNPNGTLVYRRDLEKAEKTPEVILSIHPYQKHLESTDEGQETLDRLEKVNKSPKDAQGFYFYRNDRLITRGGWNNYMLDPLTPHASQNLLRVGINLREEHDESYAIETTKTDYSPPESFKESISELMRTVIKELDWKDEKGNHVNYLNMGKVRHRQKAPPSSTTTSPKQTTTTSKSKKLKKTKSQSTSKASPVIPQGKQLSLDFANQHSFDQLLWIDYLGRKIIINKAHRYYDDFIKLIKEEL